MGKNQSSDPIDDKVPTAEEIEQDELELERNGDRIRNLFNGSGS